MIRDPPIGFIVNVVYETMVRLGVSPPEMKCGETWESIIIPDGYIKPTKEAFEAKFQEIIREYSFKELRQERNQRLADVDWIFSTDYHIPDQLRDEWTRYRQALRDLPSLTEDPENPVWPEKPTVNPSGGSTVSVDLYHLAGIASQITLLQNVVFSLTKRIQQLEQA
jgi:hypothetical protein